MTLADTVPAQEQPDKKTRELSPYNRFMKVNVSKFKKQNPKLPHKEAFRCAALAWKSAPENPKNFLKTRGKTGDAGVPLQNSSRNIVGGAGADTSTQKKDERTACPDFQQNHKPPKPQENTDGQGKLHQQKRKQNPVHARGGVEKTRPQQALKASPAGPHNTVQSQQRQERVLPQREGEAHGDSANRNREAHPGAGSTAVPHT